MYDSTVDEKEMKTFDTLSSIWWGSSQMEALRKASPFLLDYLVTKAPKRVQEVQVLDAGCGGGFLAEPMAQHGFFVIGIDVNRSMIDTAQEHAQLNPSLRNLTYKQEAIEDHAENNPEKYDIVVLSFVLQHAKNQETILKNCVKALKPGGLLLISAAAKTYWSWLNVIILAELYYGYAPRHGHNWHNFINAKDVESILRKYNCVVTEAKGIYYDMAKKCWNWHDNVNRGFYTLLVTKQ